MFSERKSILRKVQLTGGSTLTVSLPKEWIRAFGIKPGDYLEIQFQPDGSLKLMPQKSVAEIYNVEMYVDEDMSESVMIREFISRYLAGYDIIKVNFHDKKLYLKDVLKGVMNKKMIGMEVIEESVNSLTVQCLAKHSTLPVLTALKRMGNITLFMLNDFIRALEQGSKEILKSIVERDDTVDKFYIFILRQLKMTTLGLLSPADIKLKDLRECLGLRLVVKSIERIGDHIANSSKYMYEISTPFSNLPIKNIIELALKSKEIYSKALEAFFENNVKQAHLVADSIKEVQRLERKVIERIITAVKNIEDAMNLRLVTESLRRIADYSSDIAEITINLAIIPPRRLLR